MTKLRAIYFASGLMWTACLGSLNPATADELVGSIGYSEKWGSSWMDLGGLHNFSAGDTVRITLQDWNAKCVLVGLRRGNDSVDEPVGIVGGPRNVGQDLTVVVTLPADRKMIKQISVHGKQPWGRIICPNNGAGRIAVIDYTPAGH